MPEADGYGTVKRVTVIIDYLDMFFGSAAHASSFLIVSYFLLFAFSSAGAVDKIVFPEGMQSVNFDSCFGLTGTAEVRMNEVHILVNTFFAIQPHTPPPSSLYPFFSFAFPSAGAVDKLVFPEGMQSVNFQMCKGLTGTAELGISEGHILFNTFFRPAAHASLSLV